MPTGSLNLTKIMDGTSLSIIIFIAAGIDVVGGVQHMFFLPKQFFTGNPVIRVFSPDLLFPCLPGAAPVTFCLALPQNKLLSIKSPVRDTHP